MSMTIRPTGDTTRAPVSAPNAVPLSDRVSQDDAPPAWPAPEREDEHRKDSVSDTLQLAMNVPPPLLPPIPLTGAQDPPLLAGTLLRAVRSRDAAAPAVLFAQTDAQASVAVAQAQAQAKATLAARSAPDATGSNALPAAEPRVVVAAGSTIAERDPSAQGATPKQAPLATATATATAATAAAPAPASAIQAAAEVPRGDPRIGDAPQAPQAPRAEGLAQRGMPERSAARAEDAAAKPTLGTPTTAAAQPLPAAPPAAPAAPETPQLELLAQARRGAATATTRQHAKAVQQAQATQNAQVARSEAASQVNVAFHSWGVGHTVTARMEGNRVLLQPSSVRVGQALSEAVAPLEGDLQLAVEAVEDARDERRRRRREGTP